MWIHVLSKILKGEEQQFENINSLESFNRPDKSVSFDDSDSSDISERFDNPVKQDDSIQKHYPFAQVCMRFHAHFSCSERVPLAGRRVSRRTSDQSFLEMYSTYCTLEGKFKKPRVDLRCRQRRTGELYRIKCYPKVLRKR